MCCFFTSTKIRDYFSLKSKMNPFLKSCVVYKYQCLEDPDNFYIGQTKRHIGVRAGEHLDLSKSTWTAVANHISDCETCFSKHTTGELTYKNFEIIRSGNSKYQIEILEALLIKRLSPKINRQLHSSGSSFLLKVYWLKSPYLAVCSLSNGSPYKDAFSLCPSSTFLGLVCIFQFN